ncbi:MAG: ParA family protein [Cellvibrionaceae bacterium]|nr:ParA family protein [Cellvibrionaceae bacterium]
MQAKVLAVANQKGGVGKSTLSVQIGFELAERGQRVCIIDNDASGDATTALCGQATPIEIRLGNRPEATANTLKLYASDEAFTPYEVTDNLFLMGATDELSLMKGADMEPAYEFCDSLELLKPAFDYIIIDCPPSFGLLFTAAMLAATSGGVLIPMVPDELSFKAATKVKGRIDQMNERMHMQLNIAGIVANKVANNPMPQSVSEYLSEMKDVFGGLVFNTHIHQTIRISDAISLQEKVSHYAKPSSKAARQIAALTDEIVDRLGG